MNPTLEETEMVGAAVLDDPVEQYPAYDFRRPAQLDRENSRQLEAAFESFARLWSAQLTAKIRVRAHLSLESVELVSYEEYADRLPITTAMVTGSFVDRDEPCVIQFGLEGALSWVVQMMGGRSAALPEPRTFTPIELALVRHLMDGTFEHLSTSLGPLLPGEATFAAVHYNPQYLQVIAAAASVIVARYTMHLGDVQVGATVMLPASAVIDRLAESGRGTAPGHTAGQVLDQVRAAPVDVTLRVAPLTLGAGIVLDLAPGDLLRLPHPETKPFELVVGTTLIAHATTGARGSRLACTITDIPEETL